MNQRQEKAMESFSVEWLIDDDSNSFVKTLLHDTKKTTQRVFTSWIGIPAPIQKLQKELNVLTKFNDPKGQYLYCLNCGSVK